MTCHEHESALMDVARGVPGGDDRAAALEHVRGCPGCAAYLESQRALSRGLRALAAGAEVPLPGPLEQHLAAAWRGQLTSDTEPLWRAVLKVAAAVVLVAGGLLVAWRDVGQAPRQPPQPTADFVPWPGAAALPPFESGELVRTELPASVLPALGFDAPAGPAAERVKADLLVGQDGLVRAVRLAH